MNIVLRKLAMLEKSILQSEEEARLQGRTINAADTEFRQRITNLMDRVRLI